MKVKVDIDCTPQEARAFFGLPDVGPMQAALLADMEERMRSALAAMDPEALFKIWLPAGMQSLEQFQKMFWSQVGGASEKKSK